MRFSDEIWVPLLLGDQCVMTGGGTPSTKNISYWSGNIPWISSADISEDFFDIKITRRITEEAITQSATKMCPPNSILLVSRVGVGKIGIYEKPVCTSQDFTNIISYPFDKYFLAFYLQRILKRKANEAQGTSIKGITSKEIKSLKLYIPTKETQFKIGNLLKLINTRIVTQNKIIRDLETHKRFLLKEIFTTKKSNSTIGDYLKEYTKKNVNNYEPVAVGKNGIRKRSEIFSRELSEDYTKNKVIELDSLIIGMGTKQIDIAILHENKKFCVSPAYSTFKVCNIDPYYFENLLKSMNYLLSLRYMISGARQGKSVNKKELLLHKIFVHAKEEQIQFSSLLRFVDKRIDTETQILEKYYLQKQYLLNSLFI